MKKSLFVFVFFVALFSCKPKDTVEDKSKDLVTFNFKVVGLADTTIADSIWKINFLDGIESVYIKPSDSIISIKAYGSKFTQTELTNKVEEYGVKVLGSYKSKDN